jgi:hypothetical protein
LLRTASVQGPQDADTTQAAYLAGKAAMIIWSSFLLDELAGLSNDARPNCPQCRADPSFLATNSGIVTAIKGPDGSHPSQFGELTCFAITKDANPDAARLVEFLTDEGYPAWLGLAPEGKVPVRTGTTNQPTRFSDAWAHLETGVEHTKPLSELYPPGVLKVLASSTDTMNRWGFPKARAGWSAPSWPPCRSPRPWPPPSTAPCPRPPRPSRPRPTSRRSNSPSISAVRALGGIGGMQGGEDLAGQPLELLILAGPDRDEVHGGEAELGEGA